MEICLLVTSPAYKIRNQLYKTRYPVFMLLDLPVVLCSRKIKIWIHKNYDSPPGHLLLSLYNTDLRFLKFAYHTGHIACVLSAVLPWKSYFQNSPKTRLCRLVQVWGYQCFGHNRSSMQQAEKCCVMEIMSLRSAPVEHTTLKTAVFQKKSRSLSCGCREILPCAVLRMRTYKYPSAFRNLLPIHILLDKDLKNRCFPQIDRSLLFPS